MEEEERSIMKAKVEELIVSKQVEMFNAKPVEEEVVFQKAEVKVVATQGEEEVMSRLVEDVVSLQQAEVEKAIANKVDQFITYKEEGVPAPLPSYQPITFFSKPSAVEDDIGEAHEEELGSQTALQSGLLALMPEVERPEVEMTIAKRVEEVMIIKEAETEVEEIVTAKQDPEMMVYSKIQVEEEEEKVNENKVSFSMEDLEYDDATGRLFIHLESGVMEVSDPQARDQLLAKMSFVPHDDQLLASMFPAPNAKADPILSKVADAEKTVPGIPLVPLKPINFRLQEQRLTCGHLGQSKAQSLGRWTSWTRELLLSDLAAAFTKPKRGIFWSDFSPEEKLDRFDMVDWAEAYPLDPPPRSLMFEPVEDQWSTWA